MISSVILISNQELSSKPVEYHFPSGWDFSDQVKIKMSSSFKWIALGWISIFMSWWAIEKRHSYLKNHRLKIPRFGLEHFCFITRSLMIEYFQTIVLPLLAALSGCSLWYILKALYLIKILLVKRVLNMIDVTFSVFRTACNSCRCSSKVYWHLIL